MNVKDCVDKGLLARIAPDLAKAHSSLEIAAHKLELAEKENGHRIWEGAIVNAYTSMFHTARALLFKDGYKERSHYALGVFLEERYADKIERKYMTEFGALRLHRHEIMYALERNDESDEEEAEDAIRMANGFLEAVEKMLDEEKSRK